MFKRLFIALPLLAATFTLTAQISHGEIPESFYYHSKYSVTSVTVDLEGITNSRHGDCKSGCAKHIGTLIQTDSINSKTVGERTPLNNNKGIIYIAAFYLKKAQALGLSFSEIVIPENGRLFIYNQSRTELLGYYDSSNILDDGSFATEPINDSIVFLEYNGPALFSYSIDGFSYFFDPVSSILEKNNYKKASASGDCNVNIECPEGSSVKGVADAVVKIILLDSGQYFLCSGSVVNTTANDRTPYLLTAWHCGGTTRPLEFEKWVFYFQYQLPDCDGIIEEPAHKTLVGCSPVAFSENYGVIMGSDFRLVKLSEDPIPSDYNPYFAGWDVSGNVEETAKAVHHPSGDVKKVSTTYNITGSPWNENYTETHWKVYWSATESGHGVTEGGSSGCPLINTEGRIIGTLTGGTASCSDLDAPDYFGKMSYSWRSNGNDPTNRLDCWLDPANTGALTCSGFTDNIAVSKLSYSINGATTYGFNAPMITVGSEITFEASFTGEPDSCEWIFENASPKSSKSFSPEAVVYNTCGNFDLTLTLYKSGLSPKTFLFKDFVAVRPEIFPIPFSDKITVIFSDSETINNDIAKFEQCRLVNLSAQTAYYPSNIIRNYNTVELYFDNVKKGLYVLQLISDNDVINIKILKQ